MGIGILGVTSIVFVIVFCTDDIRKLQPQGDVSETDDDTHNHYVFS